MNQELKNVEFFLDRSDLTSEIIFAKFYVPDLIIPFSDFSDNMVNILYLKLLDFSGLLKHCVLPSDDRRKVVAKFIIKHWGNADHIPDIDEKGHFNFEDVDLVGIKTDLAYAINSVILQLIQERYRLEQEQLAVSEKILQLMTEKDMVKSINLKVA